MGLEVRPLQLPHSADTLTFSLHSVRMEPQFLFLVLLKPTDFLGHLCSLLAVTIFSCFPCPPSPRPSLFRAGGNNPGLLALSDEQAVSVVPRSEMLTLFRSRDGGGWGTESVCRDSAGHPVLRSHWCPIREHLYSLRGEHQSGRSQNRRLHEYAQQ